MPINKIIGTGGIGTGVIYRLDGNHDLGRNESRPARRVNQNDFCKLHIILHYTAKLLRELKWKGTVLPVGGIGDDAAGKSLLAHMKNAGMAAKYIRIFPQTPTLFSICLQYRDRSGGNLTEREGASGKISPAMVRAVKPEFKTASGGCLVLAAPEVPLESRMALLDLGRKHGAVNAASFVSDEMEAVRRLRLLRKIDLLSINVDEARALGHGRAGEKPAAIADRCITYAEKINPEIKLHITAGGSGSYSYQTGILEFLPALKVPVANTAGAGDASFAGLIIAAALGLPFLGGEGVTAVRLARLLGAMSVQSPDTINFAVTLKTLRGFATRYREKSI